MAVLTYPPLLYDALKAEGFELPENCGDLVLTMPVDGMIELNYRQMLTPDNLLQISRALARIAEQQK